MKSSTKLVCLLLKSLLCPVWYLQVKPRVYPSETSFTCSSLGSTISSIRPEWKCLQGENTLAYFDTSFMTKKRNLFNIFYRCQSYKTFFTSALMKSSNKIVHLPLVILFSQFWYLKVSPGAYPSEIHFTCSSVSWPTSNIRSDWKCLPG